MRLFSVFLNNNKIARYLKNIRNNWINEFFKRKKAEEIFLPSQWCPENQEAMCFSIAFNQPTCVDILIESWQKFAKNTLLVIVDNSSNPQARGETKALCVKNGVPYIGSPKNPEWSVNRSHALSLNWAYSNLVLKWKPKLFGFLDFDCFPFAPFDLKESMGDYNVLGPQRLSRKITNCWNLWPGFAFYRLSRVLPFQINFTHSIDLGLDTGGLNWNSLYSKLLPEEVFFVDSNSEIVKNISQELVFSSVINQSFIHLGSGGHKKEKIMKHHVIDSLKKLNNQFV